MNPRQRKDHTDRLLERMADARPSGAAGMVMDAFRPSQLEDALFRLKSDLCPASVSAALMFARQLERALLAVQARLPPGAGHY